MIQPGTKEYSVNIGEKVRKYTEHVPEGLSNPNLFVYLKGGGDSSDKLIKLFGVYLKKYNCIMVLPEALPVTRGKANFDVLSPPTVNDDYAFFDHILTQYPGMNLWVAGSSTGGAFTLYLACHGYCSSIVTLAASVWKGLVISSKPNIFAVHGKLDNSVKFAGGTGHGVTFLSAYDSIEKFSTPPIKRTITQYPLTGEMNIYTSPNQTNKVQLLTIGDLGHAVLGYKGVYNGFGLIESIFVWLSNLPIDR